MGQSSEELTSQIEDTRRRMAGDLDTLQDRVSPSAIVERRKQAVKGGFSSARDKVMGAAQNARESVSSSTPDTSASELAGNVSSSAQDRYDGAPLAAGLVAFGAGVVLAGLLPATRVEAQAAHRVVETAKEHGQPLLDEAKAAATETADHLKESATEAAQQVKQSAQDSAETVKGEAKSSAETVRDEASTS